MEPILLFLFTFSLSSGNFLLAKKWKADLFRKWIVFSGIICLLSIWVGLFFDIPEKENADWMAMLLASLFLYGLSSFYLLLMQIFRERLFHFAELPFLVYTIEPLFLNGFCFLTSFFVFFVMKNSSFALLLAIAISLFVIYPIYTFFYKKYYGMMDVPNMGYIKIFLLFTIIASVYFSVGVMSLFILSPFQMPELK